MTNQTVRKKDLLTQVYRNTALSKAGIEIAVEAFLDALVSELVQGKTVRIPELGTFKVAERKAHVGHNPHTGEPIDVPAKRVAQLKFAPHIRKMLNPTDE